MLWASKLVFKWNCNVTGVYFNINKSSNCKFSLHKDISGKENTNFLTCEGGLESVMDILTNCMNRKESMFSAIFAMIYY